LNQNTYWIRVITKRESDTDYQRDRATAGASSISALLTPLVSKIAELTLPWVLREVDVDEAQDRLTSLNASLAAVETRLAQL
jgi:hypothetical protein